MSYFGETFSLLLKDAPGELDALRMGFVDLESRYHQLLFEVNRPNGLRAKAARYDSLVHCFTNVCMLGLAEQASAYQTPWFPQPVPYASSNPAPTQMMSPGPAQDILGRNAYKMPHSVAQPDQEAANQGRATSTPSKRTPEQESFSESSKRPRVELSQESALIHGKLFATKLNFAHQF